MAHADSSLSGSLAVLGLCDDCRCPGFIDTSPRSLAEAVAQAGRYDRMPKVVPVDEAMRIWQAGVCACPKAKIAAAREES